MKKKIVPGIVLLIAIIGVIGCIYNPKEAVNGAGFTVLVMVGAFVYLLPTWLAARRESENFWIIFPLNLFAGETGILWLVCLVWACYRRPQIVQNFYTTQPQQIKN